MKKLFALLLISFVSACTSAPETYPYGMSEKEWNELSIKDKAAIRRDFYFYERGNMNFVNPQLQVEGKYGNMQKTKSETENRQNPALLIHD